MINFSKTDIIRIKCISYSIYLKTITVPADMLSYDDFLETMDYKKYYNILLREFKLKRILNDT